MRDIRVSRNVRVHVWRSEVNFQRRALSFRHGFRGTELGPSAYAARAFTHGAILPVHADGFPLSSSNPPKCWDCRGAPPCERWPSNFSLQPLKPQVPYIWCLLSLSVFQQLTFFFPLVCLPEPNHSISVRPPQPAFWGVKSTPQQPANINDSLTFLPNSLQL